MGEQVLYCYGVCGPEVRGRLDGVSGVAGAPVEYVARGELVMLAGAVDAEEFGEAALRENLEDLSWLESVARAHDRVVQAAADAAATVPLRLGTVCRDAESVHARLRDNDAALRATLARVSGRVEWGVKAYLDPDPDAGDGGTAPEAPADESGTGYLERRRAAAAGRDDAARLATETGDTLHDELAAVAVASRRHRLQDRRLTGHQGRMLLNGAYLLDCEPATRIEDRVEELRRAHSRVRLELTGPWPAYSFVDLEAP